MKIKLHTAKELHTKKSTDIEKYIGELKQNLEDLNHAIYTNKENKTHQIGTIKRAIAQAKTIQTVVSGEEK